MPLFALTAYEAGEKSALVIFALLLFLLVRRVLRTRRPGDIVAATVVGVLLVAAIARQGDDGWDGEEGRQMKAGFIAGCEGGGTANPACACMFSELVALPSYDTPREFAALSEPVRRASETGDLSLLPADFVAAAQRCVPPRA